MFKYHIFLTVYKILSGQALSVLPSVTCKIFSGTTDVTSTIFGVASISMPSSVWQTAIDNTLQNSSDISFGISSIDTDSLYTLEFYVGTIELLAISVNLVLQSGSEFIIYSGGLRITLNDIENPLASFLFNYYFKQIITALPTNWTAEIVLGQARKTLNKNMFSSFEINTQGYYQCRYGESFSINYSADYLPTSMPIYADSSGTKWFQLSPFYRTEIYANKNTEFGNNSLVFIFGKAFLTGEYIAPAAASSLFHVKLDGEITDYSGGVVGNALGILTYNSILKQFNAESAFFDGAIKLEYPNVNIPNVFTLQFFVYFQNNPTGRNIIFIEKTDVIRVRKTAANNLEISLNNTIVSSSSLTLFTGTWYHFYINKPNNNSLQINVDTLLNTSVSLPNISLNSSTAPLSVNSTSAPVIGYMQSIDISSSTLPFTNKIEPLSKRPYNWKYVNAFDWSRITFNQWKSL